jgi:uncharacterized pyridoxal phosphate-containing UPF0001 family protein
MTIGAQGDLTAFTQMQQLKQEICERHQLSPEGFELSMGMSGDFEEAVPFP